MSANESSKQKAVSLVGLSQVLTFLLVSATVAGFLGSVWWMLDLASHFRCQNFVALIAVGLTGLLLKRRRMALVCLVGALLNAAVVVPLWIRIDDGVAATGPHLRVMSFNVHTENSNKAGVVEVVRAANADVVALLEVDPAWMTAIEPLRGDYPFVVQEPREDNFGICLLSRWPIAESKIHRWGEAQAPSIQARLETNGVSLTVIATHPLPPAGRERARMRDEQLQLLADHLATLDSTKIVMGDLNTTPWGASFRQLLSATQLRDSARGSGWQPTWPDFMPLLFIPLDHVLVSPEVGVVSVKTGDAAGSDHRPVIVDLVLPQSRAGVATAEPRR
jgi:endonuclease/exonuclease/phosphatase (EEP) superfamily protein YafD